MQIKIAFKAIFLVDGEFLAGGSAKRTQKRQERFGDSAEQDSQEEGERQYQIYRSDRMGTEGKTKKTRIYSGQ